VPKGKLIQKSPLKTVVAMCGIFGDNRDYRK
jgi:hypothetical protein